MTGARVIDRLLRRLGDSIDGTLLAIAMGLLGLGLVTLYSAVNESPARLSGQLVNIGVALLVMWLSINTLLTEAFFSFFFK